MHRFTLKEDLISQAQDVLNEIDSNDLEDARETAENMVVGINNLILQKQGVKLCNTCNGRGYTNRAEPPRRPKCEVCKGNGKQMMHSPKFKKRESRKSDHREMTWENFIALRKWATETSKETGYPIYLVGSTLHKKNPRDFDIVMEVPIADFVEKFGEPTEENWPWLVSRAFGHYNRYYFSCHEVFGELGTVSLDFKVYPDTWFTEEERLLIS